MPNQMSRCPQTGLPIFTDDSGEQRRLGLLPSSEAEKGLLKSDTIPLVDEKDFIYATHEQVMAFMALFVAWMVNQRSHGSCVGFSSVTDFMASMLLRGRTMAKLSGAYVYSWLNGNRDGGASIVASMFALQKHGTCLESTVPWDMIYRSQIPAKADEEAKRFKLRDGVVLSDEHSILSALQKKIPTQIGVQVAGNFQSYDDEGVCGYGGGGSNHSVCILPFMVRKKNGGYKVPMPNTWGSGYGPYGNGMAYVDRRHILGGGGGFCHVDQELDPQDPNKLPAA